MKPTQNPYQIVTFLERIERSLISYELKLFQTRQSYLFIHKWLLKLCYYPESIHLIPIPRWVKFCTLADSLHTIY